MKAASSFNNGLNGVYIGESTGVSVASNYIGTDWNGATGLGNTLDGVLLANGDSYCQIGQIQDSTYANVISGNSGNGVHLTGSATYHNSVSGNCIGTNAVQEMAIPNLLDGVLIDGGANLNDIGVNNLSGASPSAGQCQRHLQQ